jgi:hypothetical protein
MRNAKTKTPTIPTSIAGTTGRNSSPALTCKAVTARVVGPPHGSMFIVPAARAVMQVRLSGLIAAR